MKILFFIAAICLVGTTSCTKKLCPAYSKTESVQQNIYAAEPAPALPGQARI